MRVPLHGVPSVCCTATVTDPSRGRNDKAQSRVPAVARGARSSARIVKVKFAIRPKKLPGGVRAPATLRPPAHKEPDRCRTSRPSASVPSIALGLLAATPSAEAEGRPGLRRAHPGHPEARGALRRDAAQPRPAPDDGVVEIYSSETTGTWTILMTRPDGIVLPAGRRPALGAGRPADLGKPGQRRLTARTPARRPSSLLPIRGLRSAARGASQSRFRTRTGDRAKWQDRRSR